MLEGFALVVALAALPAATAAPNWSRISFGGIARPPADLLRELPESAPCQKDGVNLGGVSGPLSILEPDQGQHVLTRGHAVVNAPLVL